MATARAAITAVDPGTTSGVARAVFDRVTDSIWDDVRGAHIESWEATGTPDEQAWEIMHEFADWVAGLKVRNAYLVVESFQMRTAHAKDSLLDPVRVTAGMATLARKRSGDVWVELNFQSPSSAKNFATNDRLRRADAWVVGSDHRRDAVRHLALAVARLPKLGGPARLPAA